LSIRFQADNDLKRIIIDATLRREPRIDFQTVVELTGPPLNEPPGADIGLLRPAPDEIDDLIPHVMRNPDAVQSSPKLFLTRYAPP
jgi:hypothetical protein